MGVVRKLPEGFDAPVRVELDPNGEGLLWKEEALEKIMERVIEFAEENGWDRLEDPMKNWAYTWVEAVDCRGDSFFLRFVDVLELEQLLDSLDQATDYGNSKYISQYTRDSDRLEKTLLSEIPKSALEGCEQN